MAPTELYKTTGLVNKYTVKDVTPLPSIQEAIEGLGDKILFSKFDI